mmetsp:Transcript_108583/g.272124  ORF Transcript_108583/g.272124 Transcript_108583/m.272124 type:complete len:219 (-) Transcript_108583:129-785(-)
MYLSSVASDGRYEHSKTRTQNATRQPRSTRLPCHDEVSKPVHIVEGNLPANVTMPAEVAATPSPCHPKAKQTKTTHGLLLECYKANMEQLPRNAETSKCDIGVGWSLRGIRGFAVGLGRGVLHDVCALLLELVPHAQHPQLPQRQEDQYAQAPGPEDDQEAREELRAQLVAAVEDTIAAHALVWVAEETQRHDAPNAASAVHRERIDHIIHLKPLKQH